MLVLLLVSPLILLIALALGGLTGKRVKITVLEGVRPMIKIRVGLEGNEVDAIALIDTGAERTSLSKSFMDKCQGPVSIVRSNLPTICGLFGSCEAWGMTEQGLLFRFSDDIECAHYDVAIHPRVVEYKDMTLGFDFLMANKIIVDIPNQELVFLKHPTFSFEVLRRRIKSQIERACLLLKSLLPKQKTTREISGEEVDTEEMENRHP